METSDHRIEVGSLWMRLNQMIPPIWLGHVVVKTERHQIASHSRWNQHGGASGGTQVRHALSFMTFECCRFGAAIKVNPRWRTIFSEAIAL
jgi:hypothetical protein